MSKPNVTLDSPRLSTSRIIGPFRSRKICQRCSRPGPRVTAWVEHDHNDKPEPIYVFLCEGCSNELIEPHIRLYREARQNEPLPGIMDICEHCPHRKGSRCESPLAQFNGGPGLDYKLDSDSVSTAFIDGPKFRGRIAIFHKPVSYCSGKET